MESRSFRVRLELGLAFICALASGLGSGARADMDPAAQIALGNPSGATADPTHPTNYLISRPQYALAYVRDYGEPRWVSWHLNVEDIGNSGRGKFKQDTSLPPGWYQVKVDETPPWSAETPVRYDRGHMCPSGDRSLDAANNQQVFLMTNILPQTPDNNQGPWTALEDYERGLAKTGNECYIIAGIRGVAKRISQGNVAVPAFLWKIILVLPDQPGNDLARITANTRVIAVEMPNVPGIRTAEWKTYRVSVNAIEKKTGLRFFTKVAAGIRAKLKAKIDTVQ